MARNWITLEPKERGLLREAGQNLLKARWQLWLQPFRRLTPELGSEGRESSFMIDPQGQSAARTVSWALNAWGRCFPQMFSCLVLAVAGKRMLRSRDLASTLYLGVANGKQKTMIAHAWLRCGNIIITGETGYKAFTVVGSLAEKD